MSFRGWIVWASAAAVLGAVALPARAEADEVYIRVVDVGNAMCVVIRAPGERDHYMLYDAGHWETSECADAVDQILGDKALDLVVLSHSDADHVGELPAILMKHPAKQIVYTGALGSSRRTWPKVLEALVYAEKKQGTRIRNLKLEPLPNVEAAAKGKKAKPLTIQLGDATVTFVAGWYQWPTAAKRNLSGSELRNVISIVVRVEYAGKSVLLTGDTIGRERSSAEGTCRYAENWMIRKSNTTLKSDVLVGQHHGGDNSSSTCFIKAVAPMFLIFPAGHESHIHPRQVVADRFLAGRPPRVPADRILRTDRGDDQGADEYDAERIANCTDKPGDDDIEIRLSDQPGADVSVVYRGPNRSCSSS